MNSNKRLDTRTLSIKEDTWEKLKLLAEEKGLKVSAFIRMITNDLYKTRKQEIS